MPSRFYALAATLIVFVASLVLEWVFNAHWVTWPIIVISGALSLVGIIDVTQTKQAIRRNYPILSHFRFFFEYIRPEIRQYFIESDHEAAPFSRADRSLVYQRAKRDSDKRPFGTQLDVYEAGYEWINHSIAPAEIASNDFRLTIGQGENAYSASVFNISAMSFGALSANAVRALNRGAKDGGFAHDTGEGSISRYHREHGGDLIWEIGSGYFGCRTADGKFDPVRFAEQSRDPQVKMVELKLSQGAKPGHGGLLPGSKVTAEIAEARGVPIGVDCVSPAKHSVFSTPIEMLEFIAKMRELSGGKPAGMKLAIGHPWEFFALAKAMVKTGITPDFIVVDGSEGGTGAAPVEFTDHVGVPLREALLLVHNTLVGIGMRDRVKVGASGKLVSAFDIARTMAMGADWCNSARGFMFAVGCIQAQTCHTGNCPTGVTTQDPMRQRALVVPDKATRVTAFHKSTMHALGELVAAAGLSHPNQLKPEHIIRRISTTEVTSLATLYKFVKPGELLSESSSHRVFAYYWERSSADSFALVH
ncbi:MAG: FMN-binding glutamate synthase family protein [Betaproteobacteria bacterium]|nr:MAG: FMN-binding glutamate synthase family protein [Betaproteobacteria bacterium]